nr:MAG TPA: hypothetical protein [Caudoviricetes sp.]
MGLLRNRPASRNGIIKTGNILRRHIRTSLRRWAYF